MSESKSKTKARAAGSREEGRGFYVYCVGEQERLASLLAEASPPAAIESEASLESVEGGALAAVVSGVSLADYGEEVLQARLTDPAWTAIRAMRHEQVVEHFAARASVVPLRFGTIYLRRDGVEKMLTERQAELRATVERLRGREEWGVSVFLNRAMLHEGIASVSPRLREMTEQAGKASPGQSYLLRKKIDALRADEVRAETKRVAALIESELAAVADGAARLRVFKDEANEHGEMTARFAFLVSREHWDAFRAAAERLADEHARTGFKLDLTGPMPPYNFASER